MNDISAATMLGIAAIIAFSVAVFFMIMLAVAHADDSEEYFSMCWRQYLDGCRMQDQQDIIQFLNNNTELWK